MGISWGNPQTGPRVDVLKSYWAKMISSAGPWFDITHTDFAGGADPTGVLDSTAAIAAAGDAAFNAGGGALYGPPGNYLASQIVLKNRVSLLGSGLWSTRFTQKAGSNKDFIINFVSPDTIAAN